MHKLFIYTLSSLLLIVLVSANIYISSSLSTAGEELKQIELEQQLLVEENRDLKNHILQSTSLQALQNTADNSGYERVSDVVSIDSPTQTVALNQ